MEALLIGLTIFMLAVFAGFEIITKIPPTLHTPLMSSDASVSSGSRTNFAPTSSHRWHRPA